MEQEKKFPTPAMLKAREKWAQKPEEEKKAFMNEFEEELRKYYGSRFPREVRESLSGQEE